MKNSTEEGFDQHDNAQGAVEQESRLIVAHTLSNHPTDQHELVPPLEALDPQGGSTTSGGVGQGVLQ